MELADVCQQRWVSYEHIICFDRTLKVFELKDELIISYKIKERNVRIHPKAFQLQISEVIFDTNQVRHRHVVVDHISKIVSLKFLEYLIY